MGPPVLPEELRILYGGDLRFPPPDPGRPYVIANFVSTIDGVVSFAITGKSGGGNISGFDEADRFIMGLLRASADAVIVGTGTLHATATRHLFVAEHVYPKAAALYSRYRREVLNRPAPPLTVIVSRTGRVELKRAVFHTPGVRVLLVTTREGEEFLAASGAGALASTEIRSLEGPHLAPASILELLRGEFGVSLLLHEGGPTLLGDFVAQQSVDELFLTLAPQLAGRSEEPSRPSLMAGVEFLPETAPWLEVVSVKQVRHHLYLRYSARGKRR